MKKNDKTKWNESKIALLYFFSKFLFVGIWKFLLLAIKWIIISLIMLKNVLKAIAITIQEKNVRNINSVKNNNQNTIINDNNAKNDSNHQKNNIENIQDNGNFKQNTENTTATKSSSAKQISNIENIFTTFQKLSKKDNQQPNISMKNQNNSEKILHISTEFLRNQENMVNLSVDHEQEKELINVLNEFGVFGDISNVKVGPIVTLYEFKPIAGTKSSRVIGLADDIARSMSAISIRIAIVLGKNAIGIEIPNQKKNNSLYKTANRKF